LFNDQLRVQLDGIDIIENLRTQLSKAKTEAECNLIHAAESLAFAEDPTTEIANVRSAARVTWLERVAAERAHPTGENKE